MVGSRHALLGFGNLGPTTLEHLRAASVLPSKPWSSQGRSQRGHTGSFQSEWVTDPAMILLAAASLPLFSWLVGYQHQLAWQLRLRVRRDAGRLRLSETLVRSEQHFYVRLSNAKSLQCTS
jgi:hypothetical protein